MSSMSTESWEHSSCRNWFVDLKADKDSYYYRHIIHACNRKGMEDSITNFIKSPKKYIMSDFNKVCLFCYKEVPKDFLLYLRLNGRVV